MIPHHGGAVLCIIGYLPTSLVSALVFPGGSVLKNLPANAGDAGSIPGLGRSTGGGNGNPPQYSCLGNPMDRGACWATVPGATESWKYLGTEHEHWPALATCLAPPLSLPKMSRQLQMMPVGTESPTVEDYCFKADFQWRSTGFRLFRIFLCLPSLSLHPLWTDKL